MDRVNADSTSRAVSTKKARIPPARIAAAIPVPVAVGDRGATQPIGGMADSVVPPPVEGLRQFGEPEELPSGKIFRDTPLSLSQGVFPGSGDPDDLINA